MSVDSKHPLYEEYEADWIQQTDVYRGPSRIKAKGQDYLPPTTSMVIDGMSKNTDIGYQNYLAYKSRAVFPDMYRDAVGANTGVINRKSPKVALPDRLSVKEDRLTMKGETLKALMRKINQEQLRTGRYGLLVDVPTNAGPDALPFTVTYEALSIINWGTRVGADGIEVVDFVVLDETDFIMDASDLSWDVEPRFRVLALSGDGTTPALLNPSEDSDIQANTYYTAVFDEDTELADGVWTAPQIAGNTLDEIPFIFINPVDLAPEPDNGPMLGLSNTLLTIYRGEADYRQTLFMQGQDTLVIIGNGGRQFDDDNPGEEDQERRVGAGSVIELPIGGDAKYVGVSSSGLSEQRVAIENDRKLAAEQGAQLLDGAGENSSGDALQIRVASRTVNLINISRTAAAAVEKALQLMAKWIGANPDDVSIEPNLDFADDPMTGKDLLEFMQAKSMGAPISSRTIHRLMVSRELTDNDYEEEITEMEDDLDTLGGVTGA